MYYTVEKYVKKVFERGPCLVTLALDDSINQHASKLIGKCLIKVCTGAVALLGISVDGFPNDKKVKLFEIGNFLLDIYKLTQKIDGFRNPLLNFDGFSGTHGTHANGATEEDGHLANKACKTSHIHITYSEAVEHGFVYVNFLI
jgi:hypothetical protein